MPGKNVLSKQYTGDQLAAGKETIAGPRKWHIIIPFYFGTNYWVTRKGGSPVRKKTSYLKRTLQALDRCIAGSDIIIAVCNERSAEVAGRIHSVVKMVDCPPKHLAYAAVVAAAGEWGKHWPETDIVMYNEDDQILSMEEGVKQDVEAHGNRFVFAPHRWEQTFWLRELYKPHRTYHFLNSKKGIINNVPENGATGPRHRFNHSYTEQDSWGTAFAACWAMHASVLRRLDLCVPYNKIALETSTQIAFTKEFASLKLTIPKESFGNFAVDHLSGYDFYRRIIYFGKLFRPAA
jgi:hypothetical protein